MAETICKIENERTGLELRLNTHETVLVGAALKKRIGDLRAENADLYGKLEGCRAELGRCRELALARGDLLSGLPGAETPEVEAERA